MQDLTLLENLPRSTYVTKFSTISFHLTKLNVAQSFAIASYVTSSEIVQNFSNSVQGPTKSFPEDNFQENLSARAAFISKLCPAAFRDFLCQNIYTCYLFGYHYFGLYNLYIFTANVCLFLVQQFICLFLFLFNNFIFRLPSCLSSCLTSFQPIAVCPSASTV